MKKLLAFALALVAIAAPATADAATLTQRVAKVEAKLACLQWTGLSEWNGYTPYVGGDGSYVYDYGIDITAASFDLANGETSGEDFRVVVVKPTPTCRAKFARAANPYGTFAAARSMQSSKVEKLRLIR